MGLSAPPLTFRARNRLIAGSPGATLIVEAGLPSGTFSTADEALAANREVLVVPGAITSAASSGQTASLYQGATPIVDDEAFADALFAAFGLPEGAAGRVRRTTRQATPHQSRRGDALRAALQAEPLGSEEPYGIGRGSCIRAGTRSPGS